MDLSSPSRAPRGRAGAHGQRLPGLAWSWAPGTKVPPLKGSAGNEKEGGRLPVSTECQSICGDRILRQRQARSSAEGSPTLGPKQGGELVVGARPRHLCVADTQRRCPPHPGQGQRHPSAPMHLGRRKLAGSREASPGVPVSRTEGGVSAAGRMSQNQKPQGRGTCTADAGGHPPVPSPQAPTRLPPHSLRPMVAHDSHPKILLASAPASTPAQLPKMTSSSSNQDPPPRPSEGPASQSERPAEGPSLTWAHLPPCTRCPGQPPPSVFSPAPRQR